MLPSPPSPGVGMVQASRPPALVLSSLAPSSQATPAMAVDSPLPSPSDIPPLSHMPTPCALEFNVTTAEPPSTPEPSCSSSLSPSGHSAGMSATPQVKLGCGCHGKPGTGRCTKCLRAPFSPTSMQDCASLLVPLGRPGQRYTLDLLVPYKAALHDLWVRARISIKEEECTFAEMASLMSTPHVSPTPPPPPLTLASPQHLLVLAPHLGIDLQFPRPTMWLPPVGIAPPTQPHSPHPDCNELSWSCPMLCVTGTERPKGLR